MKPFRGIAFQVWLETVEHDVCCLWRDSRGLMRVTVTVHSRGWNLDFQEVL